MERIADATFLTCSCQAEPAFLERHRVATTAACLQEAKHNLRDEIIANELDTAVDITPTEKPRKEIKANEVLSATDLELLSTCIARKDSAMLITDDSTLKFDARRNHVRTLTTPSFVEMLVKQGEETPEKALLFLDRLHPIYNRRKKAEIAITHIKQYRGGLP